MRAGIDGRDAALRRVSVALKKNEFKSMTAKARRPKSPSDETTDDGAATDTPDADE